MQNVEKSIDNLQIVGYNTRELQNVERKEDIKVGLTMKQWRLAKELSQEEMASKCNVHRNTYASWEENPDMVSVGNAKIIAKALGESVNTIFFDDNSTKCRTIPH